MRCRQCGMSSGNSVHDKKKNQYGFHEYLEPEPDLKELAMEMAQNARQSIMDILTGVGEMSEEDASDLIAKAVQNIRVW